jgi:hypothetical protein
MVVVLDPGTSVMMANKAVLWEKINVCKKLKRYLLPGRSMLESRLWPREEKLRNKI